MRRTGSWRFLVAFSVGHGKELCKISFAGKVEHAGCSEGTLPTEVGVPCGIGTPDLSGSPENPPTNQTTREMPLPLTISPMIHALCFWLLMNFSTASALSAETMLTMPMPMLKT